MGHCFTEILAKKLWGVFKRSCNYERPLIITHVILNKIMVVHRARDIRSIISRRMDLR